MEYTVENIRKAIEDKLLHTSGQAPEDASPAQLYEAVALTVRDDMMAHWAPARRNWHRDQSKRVYYLSVEFLLGRALLNNLQALGLYEKYDAALKAMGLDLASLEEEEPEPGLGNGGLGRLAACFMDSLAAENIPAMGCGIRYEYGLFRQHITPEGQLERPDDWLRKGNAWEIPNYDQAVEVRFGGQIQEHWEEGGLKVSYSDYRSVLAVPYDMPVVGGDKGAGCTLRLWSAQAHERISMQHFAQGEYVKSAEERELAEVVSKILYPNDSHPAGKLLRLKQHYFFVSATMQYIVSNFKRWNPGLPISCLPEKAVVHINDTHPGLAIPELMRILMDEEGVSWDEAWDITYRTFSYTNHTVMSEALEKWPEDMFRTLLPRIYAILVAVDDRWSKQLRAFYPHDEWKVQEGRILGNGQVRMANLCIALSHAVNGVSRLHAEILKADVFKLFNDMEPDKFFGITNGITPRRWVGIANPKLASLITRSIGEGWMLDADKLSLLAPFAEDEAFRSEFAAIKAENKERFANWLTGHQGLSIDPDTLFDVQAKRLHEYKRQLLNVLHILTRYVRLKETGESVQPRTFLFAAKAYPGYDMAKRIIRLILATGGLIEKDPAAKELLRVAFVENYGVSIAQKLIPAADVSEQLSTAGKEASGTGNMKFMMNGAVTVGTLDGANVEIAEAVGSENVFIFGKTAAEVDAINRAGGYDAAALYNSDPVLKRALDMLVDGTLGDPQVFRPLYDALVGGDTYLNLLDLADYSAAQKRVDAAYADKERWTRMAIANVANSGMFSSDRTIREYNDRIWHAEVRK